jgi:hypothetical protein
VGIVLTGIPYALGQGGAGDVKLAAVIGLGLGFEAGIDRTAHRLHRRIPLGDVALSS